MYNLDVLNDIKGVLEDKIDTLQTKLEAVETLEYEIEQVVEEAAAELAAARNEIYATAAVSIEDIISDVDVDNYINIDELTTEVIEEISRQVDNY